MSAGGNIVQRLFRSAAMQAMGWGGSTAATRWAGATVSGPPVTGAYLVGDWITQQSGGFCVCTVAGTPGTWKCKGAQTCEHFGVSPFELPSWVQQSGTWLSSGGTGKIGAVSGGTPPFATGIGTNAFARYPIGSAGINLSVDLARSSVPTRVDFTQVGWEITSAPPASVQTQTLAWRVYDTNPSGSIPNSNLTIEYAYVGQGSSTSTGVAPSVYGAGPPAYFTYSFAINLGAGQVLDWVRIANFYNNANHYDYIWHYPTLAKSSIIFAFDPATDSGYSLDYNGGDTIVLIQHSGATAVTLATATVTAFTTASFNVIYDATLGTIIVTKNGTQIISVTVTQKLTGTWAGLLTDTPNADTFDNFCFASYP